jgi:ketosteroid isomerase-like protein
MSHRNAELLQYAYGIRNQAEVASIAGMLHDDIVWHAVSGDLRGPDAVLTMLAGADQTAAGTTKREIHALFADDEYGMVLTTVRAARFGRRYEDRQVHCYRFRDGQVIEFWEYVTDRAAHQEFWS